jgi:hypothetical protein
MRVFVWFLYDDRSDYTQLILVKRNSGRRRSSLRRRRSRKPLVTFDTCWHARRGLSLLSAARAEQHDNTDIRR